MVILVWAWSDMACLFCCALSWFLWCDVLCLACCVCYFVFVVCVVVFGLFESLLFVV